MEAGRLPQPSSWAAISKLWRFSEVRATDGGGQVAGLHCGAAEPRSRGASSILAESVRKTQARWTLVIMLVGCACWGPFVRGRVDLFTGGLLTRSCHDL